MKTYRVTVNGRTYEVQVEEVSGSPVARFRDSAEAASWPSAKPSTPTCPTATEGLLCSPLPGVIMELRAREGMSFSRGDVLLTIEAMKMENEILAPYDCGIEEVFAAANQAVQTGDRLLRIARR